MNTLKFTSILVRLAGFYFLTIGLDILTYLPEHRMRATRALALASQSLYDTELKMLLARIILYFTLSAAFFWFATPIARIFARGLEENAPPISP